MPVLPLLCLLGISKQYGLFHVENVVTLIQSIYKALPFLLALYLIRQYFVSLRFVTTL